MTKQQMLETIEERTLKRLCALPARRLNKEASKWFGVQISNQEKAERVITAYVTQLMAWYSSLPLTTLKALFKK